MMVTSPPSLTLVDSAPNFGGQSRYAPDSDEAILLNFITTQYSAMKRDRGRVERQWYTNLAFVFGHQNIVFATAPNTTSGYKLYVPPAPPWRVRLVVNRVRPIVRKEIAKLFSQKPRASVIPASTEDDDLAAARAGEQIFDWIYDAKKLQTVFKRAGWWAVICGSGFVKTWWDPQGIGSDGIKGDICAEPVSPFHLLVPDLRALDLEQQPYVVHAMTKSIQWAQSTFDLKIAPNAASSDSIIEDGFLKIGTGNKNNQVLVLEAWFKPKAHPKLPDGGQVIIVGDRVVQITKGFPYKHGQFPFTKVDNIPVGTGFYAEAMITDLVALQREYNRTRSQIIENKNQMGRPKLMAPKGSIDAAKVTSEPGQVVFYTPGFQPPVPLQTPEIPSYIVGQIAQLQQDMDDISGQHDVSKGQNPSQVTSATALSFLQEQDDTMLSDTTESLESAIEDTGRIILGLVGQYWTEPRMVKIVGTDEAFDASIYKGEDLQGNTDLRVEAGSALPSSKAAKQAFLMDLMKNGFVPPQQGLELLDLGGINKVLDDFLTDKRQATRENLRMQRGEQLLVNEWDNHALHITVHNRFRKSQTFDQLDDNIKIAFQNHVMSHQAAMIKQQQGDPTGSGTEMGTAQGIEQANQPSGNTGAPPSPDGSLPPEQAPDPSMGGM